MSSPTIQLRRAFTMVELGLVMALIAIMAAILFPVFSRAQEAARKSRCQANLYQLGMAFQLYARDHDGRLPHRHNDLGPVVRGYVNEWSVLECELDEAAPAIRRANQAASPGTRAYASYQYRGGFTLEDRPDLPLAADWTLCHDGGASVLSLGGSVKVNRPPNLPAVGFGPRVLPPGVTVTSLVSPAPFLNDPPALPVTGAQAPGGDGE